MSKGGTLSDGTPNASVAAWKAPLRPSPRSFAESPGKAIEVLVERGYTACEIDFATGFWMDYPWAEGSASSPAVGESAFRPRSDRRLHRAVDGTASTR